MRFRRTISADEVRSLMPAGGGVGFIFHATDWASLSFGLHDVPPRSPDVDEALWAIPPSIGSVIRLGDQAIGANIISAVPAEVWAGDHNSVQRFRDTQYHRCLALADQCGLRIVALGALTPYACFYGRASRPEPKPAITTGHAATAAILRGTVLSICDRLSLSVEELRLAVFGAAGMMGSGTLNAFSSVPCQELILIDLPEKLVVLNRRRAEAAATAQRGTKVSVATYTGDGELPEFDGAVLVTNATQVYLTAADLRKAKFWVDDSHPRAASLEAEQAVRNDTLYVECYARGPFGLDTGYPFRLPSGRDCYACFAEGYVAWAEGRDADFVTGLPTAATIDHVDLLLKKHGFAPGPLSGKDGTPL